MQEVELQRNEKQESSQISEMHEFGRKEAKFVKCQVL